MNERRQSGYWFRSIDGAPTRLDFVVAAFALAESPIAPDQELVQQQLCLAGFDTAVQLEAKTLTAITEKIVRSNMRDGLAELDAYKLKHANAPWLRAIQPRSYTGLFLLFSSEDIKSKGPALAQGLSFDCEPRPVIESIKPRQLWLLGGRDQQPPNTATQAILKQIQSRRPNINVVVFPKADHGLVENTKTADGVTMAYSDQLFDVTARWIKDQKLPAAGKFIVMPITK